MIRYEAWDDEGDITFAPTQNISEQKSKGLISPEAKKLYEIEAESHEEAMTEHYKKMGWSPYNSQSGMGPS